MGLPKGKWVDELTQVVWAHNTTVSKSTKFTPFKLLYGEEAMAPEEIKFEGPRTNVQIIEEEEQFKILRSIRRKQRIGITKK